ncbi:hypothetical protein BJX99DRAFT_237173 [Aspergillus californicus]
MDGPPPPPPPHGEKPNTTHGEYRKSSDLPEGNYDIFIIPPHSAGSGFLYLPSLQCQRNSFVAGSACTLVAVYLWTSFSPTVRLWYATTLTNGGGTAIAILAVGIVGIAGWAFGSYQGGHYGTSQQKRRGPGFGPSWFGSGGSGGAGDSGAGSPGGGGSSHSRGGSFGGQGGGPHQHGNYGGNFAGGPPPGSQYSGNQYRANNDPPPQTPGSNPNSGPDSGHGPQASPPPPSGPDPGANPGGPSAKPAGPGTQSEDKPHTAEDWEKAREETRRKEELRRKMEEFKRKREAEAREKERQREREQMEKELRERRAQLEKEIAAARAAATREARLQAEKEAAEHRARLEREAAEARAKAEKEVAAARQREQEARQREEEARTRAEQEAAEAQIKAEREAAEAKARRERLDAAAKARRERLDAAAKEKAEKEAAEKEAAAKEAAKKEADAKFAALKEAAARKYAEKKARDAQEAAAAKEAAATASKVSSASAPPPRTPSPKKPAAPQSKASAPEADDDAYSFRPYDRPRRPYGTATQPSEYSESSYAPSQSTARTTPPPSHSHRGAYETKDPDKIVIRGVFQFNKAMLNTPVAHLMSGQGMVTDGLVLRITTEGLFIDDDVRGVPQREWDVKAWTMKLVEVWCPQVGPPKANTAKGNQAFFRRSTNDAPSPEESDAYLANFLKVCKNTCRLASPAFLSRNSTDSKETSPCGGLHILRASIRDQENRKYLFVLQETEGWKVALGLQRLRKGSQVRALGVCGIALAETRTILSGLGY